MMDKEFKYKIVQLFREYSSVKLVYFFGSRAEDNYGPLSDYDFAIYFHGISSPEMIDIKIKLTAQLSLILNTDHLDIVILNLSEKPELKYAAIKDGNVLYEIDAFKTRVEPRILNEYFDFRLILERHKLSKPLQK